jgi:hypothetical protein
MAFFTASAHFSVLFALYIHIFSFISHKSFSESSSHYSLGLSNCCVSYGAILKNYIRYPSEIHSDHMAQPKRTSPFDIQYHIGILYVGESESEGNFEIAR